MSDIVHIVFVVVSVVMVVIGMASALYSQWMLNKHHK